MADTNPIKIFKGDDTDFNNSKFLSIKINTEMDLTGFKGIFKLGKFKTEQDMQSKTMEIVIPHEVTALMLNGTHTGIFTLIDTQNRVKTLSNTIPFLVTSEVFTQEEDSIELPVPDGFPYEIIVDLGGASDYNSLQNIPTFNGQPIKGNLTFQSTGIAPLESLDALTTVVNQKANTADVQNACGQLQEQITTNKNDIAGLGDQTAEIEAKIPDEASDTNQLADKQFVQNLTSALNFVKWVDTLPETGESKYIYAVPREETDTDGKPIAALYLWDGTRWNGAGAFSLNIDPATLATKTDLTNYLPLTGGTLSGDLNVKGNKVLDTSDKSVANGVASLDGTAKLPVNQLPNEVILNGDVLLDLLGYPKKSKRIYQQKLDDTFYCADKRFTVTLTNFDNYPGRLFDADDESYISLPKGQTGSVLIEGTYNFGPGYPYGYLYATFFPGCGLTDISNITCRVYQDWTGHNVGWVNLNAEEIRSLQYGDYKSIEVVRFRVSPYGIRKIELNFDNTDGTSPFEGDNLRVTFLSYFKERVPISQLPVVTKVGANTLYGNVTIPTQHGSFVGNLTGTADKSVKDSDGNTISSTYIKSSTKGTSNGVASLDTNGKVPSEQIPVATASTLGGVKVEFDETTGTLNIKTE